MITQDWNISGRNDTKILKNQKDLDAYMGSNIYGYYNISYLSQRSHEHSNFGETL